MTDADKAGTPEEVIEAEFVEAGRPASRRRRWRWLPWVLVLLLAAFIAGLFAAGSVEERLVGWGLLPQPETATDPQEDTGERVETALSALERRIATLEAALAQASEETGGTAARQTEILRRLAALESRPREAGGESGDGAALAALRDRVAALEAFAAESSAAVTPEEVARLSDALAAAAVERRNLRTLHDALARRLTAIEAAGGGTTPGVAARLLAVGDRLARGRPFADALALLEAEIAALPPADRVGPAQDLAILRRHAESGVATLTTLAGRFDRLSFELQRQAPAAESGGWWFRLRTLVVVRPRDAAEGPGIAATIARAEVALKAGDLAQAVAEIASLPPDARAPADDWLDEARGRLATERAFAGLVARLGSAGEDP